MALYELSDEQAEFSKTILGSILPTQQQCQSQDAMRQFLNICAEIKKRLDNPIQPAGKPKNIEEACEQEGIK